MIKTEKILHLKSSRGRRVRVVREHYLRARVPCSSCLCQADCANGKHTCTHRYTHTHAPVHTQTPVTPNVSVINVAHYLTFTSKLTANLVVCFAKASSQVCFYVSHSCRVSKHILWQVLLIYVMSLRINLIKVKYFLEISNCITLVLD